MPHVVDIMRKQSTKKYLNKKLNNYSSCFAGIVEVVKEQTKYPNQPQLEEYPSVFNSLTLFSTFILLQNYYKRPVISIVESQDIQSFVLTIRRIFAKTKTQNMRLNL
jgi:hypothetical protein